VGLRADEERLGQLQASWFSTRIDDEILFNDLPGNDQNQNFDTRRTGLELRLEPRLPVDGLTGSLTYTVVDAEFRKGPFAGQTLPGTPKHQLGAALSYEVLPGLVGSLDWLLVDDVFRINDFNNRLPGDNYGVLNVGLRFDREPYSVYFRIENVTNEEYTTFQSSDGVTASTGENPAPPITFLGGVTVRF
jgi:outer membrane receptor protein involved in Fe transport